MRPIIPVTLEILMLCTAEYSQVIMGTKGPPRDIGEDENDSRQFYDLIYNIFYSFEVFSDRLRTTLYDKLADIIYNLIVYMAVTTEIEKKWLEDEEFFLTCDEDFHLDVRLRMKASAVLVVR